jgi:integrase
VVEVRRARIRAWPLEGLHALRHTAASAWLAGGVDIVAVAAWLGDTVKMVYETYAHLMPNSDDRGRSAMNAFFMEEPSAPDVPSRGRK